MLKVLSLASSLSKTLKVGAKDTAAPFMWCNIYSLHTAMRLLRASRGYGFSDLPLHKGSGFRLSKEKTRMG